MFNIILVFFLIQFTVSIVLFIGYVKSKKFNPLKNSQHTTVIIPFKNEAERILPLLKSINHTAIAYKKTNLFSHFQFIFIDDHSIDESAQVIFDNLDISFQIIKLRNTKGKKYAIKKGVELSNYNRILTLDADVRFEKTYLDFISKTPCEALTILPVDMRIKNNILRQLFSVEFWFLQRLTFGLSGFKKYILCNGANLLFTKSAFNQTLKIRQDANLASGDDLFLLQSINTLKLPINAVNIPQLTVETPPAINGKELLNQRKRWISKMKDLPSVLGGLFVLISNGLLLVTIYKICHFEALYFIPFGIKVISELLSVDGLRKKPIIILHQLYYPFYLVRILVSLPLSSTDKKWK